MHAHREPGSFGVSSVEIIHDQLVIKIEVVDALGDLPGEYEFPKRREDDLKYAYTEFVVGCPDYSHVE